MARKRKVDQDAEDAEFHQQTQKFRNVNVRRAHFHSVTEAGATVDTSVLARAKRVDMATDLIQEGQDDGLQEDGLINTQTQVSANHWPTKLDFIAIHQSDENCNKRTQVS